jgi:hypothetical protein
MLATARAGCAVFKSQKRGFEVGVLFVLVLGLTG